MAENERFQGFFSYTHLDAEIDPDLVEALTARLEKRVSRKLTNASFAIWRDRDKIRTGDRWDDRIGDAVRASQVFIVLMTPKWFERDYCRKEYQIFQEVERGIAVGEYVVPLLAHAVEKQIKNFNREQKATYEDLNRRHYKKTIATTFRKMTADQRELIVEEIADDIEGMIERLRGKSTSPQPAGGATPSRRASRTYEFTANSLNADEVDFVSAAEILVEPGKGGGRRGVFVDLAFVERLHVERSGLRVEFSLRQAFLSIDDGGTGKLERNPDWARFAESGNIYYITFKSPPPPPAITVCINPQDGRTGISALPLPPAEHENHLSKPATAAPDIDIGNMKAELKVSLSPEGLFIAGEDSRKRSPAFYDKVAAIAAVCAGKDCRPLRVRERTS